jgi:hypothetical protein
MLVGRSWEDWVEPPEILISMLPAPDAFRGFVETSDSAGRSLTAVS